MMKWKVLLLLCLMMCGQQINAADHDRIAKRDAILREITGAKIPQYEVSILKMGAKGNGVKDCKPAFDKAMKMAKKKGGAHIIVPEGTYLINGPIHFESNVCLELQENAVLKFSPEPRYYLPMVKTGWEGTFLQNYSPFIYGYQLHDVSIIGKGTIDGNASTTFSTWKPNQKRGQQLSREMNHQEVPIAERNFGDGYWLRPHLVQFFQCKNITIEGVFITNTPFWCVVERINDALARLAAQGNGMPYFPHELRRRDAQLAQRIVAGCFEIAAELDVDLGDGGHGVAFFTVNQ